MSNPSTETTGSPEGTELPASERHSLLAAKRRRLALDILAGQSTAVTLDELAVAVAAQEEESNNIDEETIEHVTIALHHTHLPKMADIGVIDYDPESHWIDPHGISVLDPERNNKSADC